MGEKVGQVGQSPPENAVEHRKPKRRGRALYGENHPRCRVSDEDVELMHLLRAEGLSMRQVWLRFDNYDPPLGFETVRDILRGSRRGRRG